jgi:hypothetical protein
MLAFLRMAADISRWCTGRKIGYSLLATHPYRRTIRELTPANGIRSKVEQGREYILCPVRSIR